MPFRKSQSAAGENIYWEVGEHFITKAMVSNSCDMMGRVYHGETQGNTHPQTSASLVPRV